MIKNLLFDLGGVILDIRRERCVEAFKALGMTEVERYLGDYEQAGFFGALERGDISPDEFMREVHSLLPAAVTDAEIVTAFNRFLVGIPVERLRRLEMLHRHYRIYMLSNTNAIMWHTFITDEFRKDGRDMAHYFDGTVTSFEAHACKPDEAIFELVSRKFEIKPEETLFFDDSEANCSAARALGFNAAHVPPQSGFEAVIESALQQSPTTPR